MFLFSNVNFFCDSSRLFGTEQVRLLSRSTAVFNPRNWSIVSLRYGGRIKEYLSPKEFNSFSCKMILLFLPPVMAAGT